MIRTLAELTPELIDDTTGSRTDGTAATIATI
jgi:hypothetical protein